MTRDKLYEAIKSDLSENFKSTDGEVLGSILDEVIADALRVSNRDHLCTDDDATSKEKQIEVLASNIRKCVKSIYLQRGSEDVSQLIQSGLNTKFDDALQVMEKDIIRSGKRIWV